jgi:hypothetical protein
VFGEMERVRRDGACSARWSVFGEMEQHSLPREGFHTMVKKVANMFAKNDFPQKWTSKEYSTENYTFLPFFTIFYLFLSLFIFRSIMVAT